MNKSELAAAVAERTESTPTEARRQVDAVLDSIVESVSAGERVSLLGFGTFTGAERPARTARNPRTGDTIDVPAAVVPRFRAGSGFKARVSGSEPAPARSSASAASTGTSAAPSKSSSSKASSKSSSKDKKSDKDKGSKNSTKDSKKKSKKKNKKSKKK
ncbi:HU family DNA-binding protein [Isoptericola sp. AK164]|uniref:HU family DNA-binding protein n=1 Tax=Isoptericola sp. AK164 TaxID=3024246 RepID=UPI00241896E3|nr:HU family DNA-binding protein [Isoptericola sp. AK164]